jgi:hypothetical protein
MHCKVKNLRACSGKLRSKVQRPSGSNTREIVQQRHREGAAWEERKYALQVESPQLLGLELRILPALHTGAILGEGHPGVHPRGRQSGSVGCERKFCKEAAM